VIRTGNTFLMQDGPGIWHLWVVLRMVRGGKETICVIVNLSSRKCPARTCSIVLTSRDHPFLKKESFIRCDHSRTFPLKNLEALFKKGKIQQKDDMKETVLAKIRKTVSACRTTSREVKSSLA